MNRMTAIAGALGSGWGGIGIAMLALTGGTVLAEEAGGDAAGAGGAGGAAADWVLRLPAPTAAYGGCARGGLFMLAQGAAVRVLGRVGCSPGFPGWPDTEYVEVLADGQRRLVSPQDLDLSAPQAQRLGVHPAPVHPAIREAWRDLAARQAAKAASAAASSSNSALSPAPPAAPSAAPKAAPSDTTQGQAGAHGTGAAQSAGS